MQVHRNANARGATQKETKKKDTKRARQGKKNKNRRNGNVYLRWATKSPNEPTKTPGQFPIIPNASGTPRGSKRKKIHVEARKRWLQNEGEERNRERKEKREIQKEGTEEHKIGT